MPSIRIEAENMSLTNYGLESQSFSSGTKLIKLTNETGSATTIFNGTSGIYNLLIGYHDENETVLPAAQLSVSVNDTVIDSWQLDRQLGNGYPSTANFLQRTLANNFSLNNGDRLTINAVRGNGELARVDYLELVPVTVSSPDPTPPPAPVTTPIRIEAENMSLTNYRLESQSFSSGTKLIKLTNETGSATTIFNGTSGIYNLLIGYHDENETVLPAAQLSVSVNDTVIDSWQLDRQLGNGYPSTANFLQRTLANNFSLNNGDRFTINAVRGNGELARVDYLELVPVTTPVTDQTPPTATVAVNNLITLGVGSHQEVSFTVTYSDNVAINLASLDNLDVRVTGANGFNQLASLVSVDSNTNGSPRTATYKIVAPISGWSSDYSGNYAIAVEANQVSDTSGNFVQNGSLGTFDLSIVDTLSYLSEDHGIIARLDQNFVFVTNYDHPVKIMPLGDSITRGLDGITPIAEQGGYRTELWDLFEQLGLEVDFVGSLSHGPNSLEDKNHEGHGGKGINWIRDRIDGYLTAQQPDVVLLMIGTNDANTNGNTMAQWLSNLIDEITEHPLFHGELLVASIAPVHPDSQYQGRIPNVNLYNSLIPNLVNTKRAEGKQVTFVDVNSSLSLSDLAYPLDNGLHPNNNGYQKIAATWYDAILNTAGDKDLVGNVNNIIGSVFDDLLVGNTADNNLNGSAGNDTLIGGTGNDTLRGGNGDDLLFGDAGVDILFGDAGVDVFAIQSSATSDRVVIEDFVDGVDLLGLSGGLTFFDLTIENNSNNTSTWIKQTSTNNILAVLSSVDSTVTLIDNNDFVTI